MDKVLSITGIVLCSLFIILPPIFRLVFKEKVPVLPPVLEQVEEKISCSLEQEDMEGYKLYQYTITGLDDVLQIVAYTENFKYQQIPENVDWECSSFNNFYQGREGIYSNCKINENDRNLDIRITVSNYVNQIPTEIISYQNDTFTSYHTKLVESGFTCDKIQ